MKSLSGEPGSGHEHREILVVDDDDDLRAVVKDILDDEGFSVAEAKNGRAALDYLCESQATPTLILLDLNMPRMSGRELINVLRRYSRFSNIPIVLVTSEVPFGGAPEEGTVGRLQKPFHARDLIELVRQKAQLSCSASAMRTPSGPRR